MSAPGPFAPPKADDVPRPPVAAIALVVVAVVCLLGGCVTPVPAVGGVAAMLLGSSALSRVVAVPAVARSTVGRTTLGAALVVTALGVLVFLGTIAGRLFL